MSVEEDEEIRPSRGGGEGNGKHYDCNGFRRHRTGDVTLSLHPSPFAPAPPSSPPVPLVSDLSSTSVPRLSYLLVTNHPRSSIFVLTSRPLRDTSVSRPLFSLPVDERSTYLYYLCDLEVRQDLLERLRTPD